MLGDDDEAVYALLRMLCNGVEAREEDIIELLEWMPVDKLRRAEVQRGKTYNQQY
jgi:hypothetical protein